MKLPIRRGGRQLNRVIPALGMVTALTAVGVALGSTPQHSAAAATPTQTFWPSYGNPAPVTSTTAPGAPTPGRTGTAPSPSSPSPTLLPPGVPTPLQNAPMPSGTDPGPGRIWTLTSTRLTLSGTQFHGYSPQQVCGKTVQTLHFTVSRLQIQDLVQRGQLLDRHLVTAAGAPGSMSTVTNGPTELYTVSLSGTLNVLGFPIIPITLSPNGILPPNLDLSFLQLPDLTFTNVVVRNVDLNGGNLKIPGAHIEVTDNNAELCP